VNSFDTLSSLLWTSIKDSLQALGFTKPTEIQAKIIPILLENYNQDVHAQAQTGTGKTLAFGIPLLQAMDASDRHVQGLVIAPTRELVLQIYENLKDVSRGSNIAIDTIYGGMPITRQIDSLKRGVHIIVGTPGRLNDLLRRGALKLDRLKVLVLDEADIMLDMGFREEIDEVLEAAPKNRSIWLFSATVMDGIKKLIKSHMHNVLTIQTERTAGSSPQITQYYCVAPEKQRIEATTRFIEAAPDFNGIIFCRTKVLSSEITEELASKGLKVNCLHGDMKQSLRNHVIKGFKNRDFNILVATDVAARGIDVSDLSHVINYSIPDDIESYVHRIGRTGRAGKEGIAILLISPSQIYRIKRLEKTINAKLLEIAIPSVEAIVNVKMGAVSDFIEQAKKGDKKHAAVDNAISKILDSFSQEQIRLALEVALREKFFQGVHESKQSFVDNVSMGTIPQEICLELGQENGIEEDQVRSYLYTGCKLVPQEVTKVRVLKFKTFISIPESRLKSCLEYMRSNPIIKGKHKAYLVKDEYRPGAQSSRSQRGFKDKDSSRKDRFKNKKRS
jgi:ATP-dependent RNA helicase DeaD